MEDRLDYGVPTGHVPRIGAMANDVRPTASIRDSDHVTVFGIPTQKNFSELVESMSQVAARDNRAHNHYYKDVSKLQFIDVYRVLGLFSVTDPCLQHAVKKLLVAGGRGAGKDIYKDVQEAIDSLVRYQEIQKENGV